MCKFKSKKKEVKINGKKIIVDSCMAKIIEILNKVKTIKTLGCCCGHGKYTPSIICEIKPNPIILEIISNTIIPRNKRYYTYDKQGYAYIKELQNVRTIK